MSSLGSDSLNRLLVAAQQGDNHAREEIAQWMIQQVRAKTASVLRNGSRNQTNPTDDGTLDSQTDPTRDSFTTKPSPSYSNRTPDIYNQRRPTRDCGSASEDRSDRFDYVGRDFEQQVIRHSSLANTVLLKLIQGKTIDRANHLGYLRMAIVRATKNVLFDILRHRAARKRSMNKQSPPDYPWLRQFDEQNWDLAELNRALEELEKIDLRKASVISMRCFMQMTMQEIADSLGVSKSTVEADWSFSRAWLKKRLE